MRHIRTNQRYKQSSTLKKSWYSYKRLMPRDKKHKQGRQTNRKGVENDVNNEGVFQVAFRALAAPAQPDSRARGLRRTRCLNPRCSIGLRVQTRRILD